MFNLQNTLKEKNASNSTSSRRIKVRDLLLNQEIKELETVLKDGTTCHLRFPSKGELHKMELTITPNSGIYNGGVFKFSIEVPEEYNMQPPIVHCLTKIWHPNIQEDGKICLSVLRKNSLDGFGWMPTRKIKDVIFGLDSLFTDLIDFDDALNNEAAQQYFQNKEAFTAKAKEYIRLYCKK